MLTLLPRRRAGALTCALVAPLAVLLGVSAAAQSELVIHEEGTKLYHRPGCPVIKAGPGVLALTRAQAESRGYKAHPDCENPAPRSTGPGAPSKPGEAGPLPSQTVYIDAPRYYHRRGCARLGKGAKAVALETALKTHWPCPACKAPTLKRNTPPAIPGTDRRRGG